ncbi:NifU family protein [Candidatus Mycobacterium methanotrophicum]|uniref:NifU family protein n=1 Tax=Candidatus Mycobacterium methanotrophicum TaxID=2943498 RepID=A0ABY4QFP1_9MYCO|nr:NifU family protein [Candidatus Mycobacterium methanotrophicum]UQX09326.1 NifU family protein [Candidatus Mycobacterium methanotrophicum]
MIPIHATATADPQQLRWLIAADRLPPPGTVRRAPGRLGALLDGGTIDEIVIRTGEMLIALNAGNSWREFGDDVWEALTDALLDPAGWQVDASDNGDRLAVIAAELLAGPIGALAQSHGGSIELVSVVGHTVTVRTSGACHGCPAASSTLHEGLQRQLRRRVGQQVTVCTENDLATPSLGKKLLSLFVR